MVYIRSVAQHCCYNGGRDCWRVSGSSVLLVLHLNCKIVFKKPLVISRKGCIQTGLTLNLLTTTIVAPPSNASKWQMGFNSAFKGFNG